MRRTEFTAKIVKAAPLADCWHFAAYKNCLVIGKLWGAEKAAGGYF